MKPCCFSCQTALTHGRHAGYTYSGPAAAWAYKCLDLSNAKRIFLLGPSHAWGLPGCALTKHDKYETPLGDLVVDRKTVEELEASKEFVTMSESKDETEHSMEMHLPYIYKMLSLHFKSEAEHPPIIPILVGGTQPLKEKLYGQILAPYLADPTSVFIVSSDFCHWGLRFQYTYYLPAVTLSTGSVSSHHRVSALDGRQLRRRDKNPTDPPIYESIARLDKMSMDAVEGGKHDDFIHNIDETGNTVCGRHPIGVIMAAVEVLRKQGKIGEEKGQFKFVRYERNEDVDDVQGSSVSYASAFAVM